LSELEGAGRREEAVASRTRTLVVCPYPTARVRGDGGAPRSPEARREEAVGLARAIGLDVVDSVLVGLAEIRPAAYLGKGKVAEFAERIEADKIALVVVDAALSPVQQRNLEKAFKAKVIDRTGLILEIFGRRARTAEGALQVELAHLTYQKSRLVRSWTHLERQRGGFGFLGGPGETQIETDRRLIEERMIRIERDLDKVKKTRALHRASRADVPYPIVALVGYTNAGKSTLFNRLTRADVVAADMLFATLDPTMRLVKLPHGGAAILSDTVGFISDLPTMLISAFRATLEEVRSADVIVHVRDIAHADSDAQAKDVEAILAEVGVAGAADKLIEVWNKLDKLDADHRAALTVGQGEGSPIAVSALTGEGVGPLLQAIETRLARGRSLIDLDLESADGQGLHWLYEHTEVMARRDDEDGGIRVTVRVPADAVDRVMRRFGAAAR
jgi:GTP-binding protein HflX